MIGTNLRPTRQAASTRRERQMHSEIALGAGRYVINHGYYGDRAAVFIEKAPKAGEVGADASESGLRLDQISYDGAVITFENLASIEALEAELAEAKKSYITRRLHPDEGADHQKGERT